MDGTEKPRDAYFCTCTSESESEMFTGDTLERQSFTRMMWGVKYEVNYLNSFRQFPKGSASGCCIILHCCTWRQSYEDCLRVWFYRILQHNVEKQEIFTRPQKKKKCFLPTLVLFYFFFFFFFFFRIKIKRKKYFCLRTYPTFFGALAETRVFF